MQRQFAPESRSRISKGMFSISIGIMMGWDKRELLDDLVSQPVFDREMMSVIYRGPWPCIDL